MNNSQTATSVTHLGRAPRVSFSSLPLEVKDQIVKLVDEQDAKYRTRMRANTNLKKGSSSGVYGKGINQFSLYSHELQDLASRYLYSELCTRISENPLFSSCILPRYKHCFSLIRFDASRKPYDLSSGDTFPPALVALPHLSNLATIRVERFLKWIPEFIHLYDHHPFSGVATEIRHLEINLYENQDMSGDFKDDLDPAEHSEKADTFLLQLLETVRFVTPLKLEVYTLTDTLLDGLTCLRHPEILNIVAFGVIFYYSEGELEWKQCESLKILSIEIVIDYRSRLIDWIQFFGKGLRTLSLKCLDPCRAIENYLEDPCFLCLRHLSLTLKDFPEDMWQNFTSDCLTFLSINDQLQLGRSDGQLDFVDSEHYVNISEVGTLWEDLEDLGKLGSRRKESKDYEVQAHKVVEEFCKLRHLTYRYKTSTLVSTWSSHQNDEPLMRNQYLEDWEQEVQPVLAYGSRMVDKVTSKGDIRVSKEVRKALSALRDLKMRDEE